LAKKFKSGKITQAVKEGQATEQVTVCV